MTVEIFRMDAEETFARLSRNLRSGRHDFTQYREALKSKGAGRRPRVVSIPTIRDRVVLRALAELLGGVYPEARGVVPQLRVQEVQKAVEAGQFDTFVRLDVKDFYPSIPHGVVKSRISRRIRKPQLVDLLMKAISTPTVPDRGKKRAREVVGVPQGLAISNLLAELVAQPIDRAMRVDSRCAYFRYVDDVLILCNEKDARVLARRVIRLFGKQGLEVHELNSASGKSHIGKTSGGFDYLGYIFSSNSVSVRLSSVHKVESALARAFTRYAKSKSDPPRAVELERCAWKVNLIITGCIYKNVARGWLHYFRQMNDLTLLKRLDATVRRFERRFGLPQHFQVKTFMRTYWKIKAGQSGFDAYIPNFDDVSISDMRLTLAQVFGVDNAYAISDEDVRKIFDRRIGKTVEELEEDIGFVS